MVQSTLDSRFLKRPDPRDLYARRDETTRPVVPSVASGSLSMPAKPTRKEAFKYMGALLRYLSSLRHPSEEDLALKEQLLEYRRHLLVEMFFHPRSIFHTMLMSVPTARGVFRDLVKEW